MSLLLLTNLNHFKSLRGGKSSLCIRVNITCNFACMPNFPFLFWLDFTCWLIVPPIHVHFQNYSFGFCFCCMIQLSMKQRSRLKMLLLACLVFLGCSSRRVCLGRPICSMFGTELVRWFGKPRGRAIYLILS